MSENEEEIEKIIRVTVIPKNKELELGENFPAEEARKGHIIPEILITDHSDYSIKGFYDIVECETYSDALTHENRNIRLVVKNEFEEKPNELMPQSFVSYVSSCHNLIGQIQELAKTRPSAVIWIQQFDKELDDAIKAVEMVKEEERKAMQKAERIKKERKKREKDKNKQLLNPVPSKKNSGRSCHDRVCIIPLVQLKRHLRKYKEKIIKGKEQGQVRKHFSDEDILTSTAVTLMNMHFLKYLKVDIYKKENSTFFLRFHFLLIPSRLLKISTIIQA